MLQFISTGDVAALLGVPEHRITSQVRLGKIRAELILGRRAWTPDQVVQLARLLGRDTVEVRRRLDDSDVREVAR